MMSLLKDALTIAKKDIVNEFKTKQNIGMMIIFAAVIILIFGFAFDPVKNTTVEVIPGLIWVITIFSGILGLNRSFLAEQENDSLTALKAAPIDLSSIYIGKVISNYTFVAIVQLISVPFLFIIFNFKFSGNVLLLILLIFVGTAGFIIVGTFLSALATNAKNSEMLLPVLLLPLLSPLLIAAVQATRAVLEQVDSQEIISWLQLMLVYDLIFFVACFLLFDYTMEGS